MRLVDGTATPRSIPEASTGDHSCTGDQWLLKPVSARVQQLVGELGIPRFIAVLLSARNINTRDEAEAFFTPTLESLHGPLLLCGMAAAVDRIVCAVQRREPILIYGDYDVDGTLATVLLKTAIDRITPKGTPSLVRYHIPHRIREGYGVQTSVLTEAASAGVRLVISVDTGIRAFAAAQEAKALGLDLIVTDHHLPDAAGVPEAIAVINPNQTACSYPEKNLCGAAVAYKLADALLRSALRGTECLHAVEPAGLRQLQLSLLKLAAIATVADAVPLTGENRAIVSLGLHELREVRQYGLRELMRLAQAGQGGTAPSATEIAFRIAPRINAAGRMDVASDVVRLLLTRDIDEAQSLAQKLHSLNEERRKVEASVLQEIEAQLMAMVAVAEAAAPYCYVVDGQNWHRGVVGILASRVVDRTNRPALVITHDQDGNAHGSGRSVAGFHLLEALESVHLSHLRDTEEQLFQRFGGHAHAVGFSLPSGNVSLLRDSLQRFAESYREHLERPRSLHIDAELPLHEVNPESWRWLQRMQPFGNGNNEPVFLALGVPVLETQSIKDRHLKLRVQVAENRELTCMCWARSFAWTERFAQLGIAAGSDVDLVYQLRWNQHPDFGGLELQVCDVRLAAPLGE